jgi:hypothetical protein
LRFAATGVARERVMDDLMYWCPTHGGVKFVPSAAFGNERPLTECPTCRERVWLAVAATRDSVKPNAQNATT